MIKKLSLLSKAPILSSLSSNPAPMTLTNGISPTPVIVSTDGDMTLTTNVQYIILDSTDINFVNNDEITVDCIVNFADMNTYDCNLL